MALNTGPWTADEIAQIFLYLGVPRTFFNFDPRVTHAIKSVQSVADGGALADSSTQQLMRQTLLDIADIDNKITQLTCSVAILATDTPKVQMDAIRGIQGLQCWGRKLIKRLVIPLGLNGVFVDYYTGASIQSDPFGSASARGVIGLPVLY